MRIVTWRTLVHGRHSNWSQWCMAEYLPLYEQRSHWRLHERAPGAAEATGYVVGHRKLATRQQVVPPNTAITTGQYCHRFLAGRDRSARLLQGGSISRRSSDGVT